MHDKDLIECYGYFSYHYQRCSDIFKFSKVQLLNHLGSEIVKREEHRIKCLGTIHPDIEDPCNELERIADTGLKGVKFQPTVQ